MPVLNNMVATITRKYAKLHHTHNLTPTLMLHVIGRLQIHPRIFSMVNNILQAKIYDATTILETLHTTIINSQALRRLDQNGIKPHLRQRTIFSNKRMFNKEQTPPRYMLTQIRNETQHGRSLCHSPDRFQHINDSHPPSYRTHTEMTINEANLSITENINNLVKPQNHPPNPPH